MNLFGTLLDMAIRGAVWKYFVEDAANLAALTERIERELAMVGR